MLADREGLRGGENAPELRAQVRAPRLVREGHSGHRLVGFRANEKSCGEKSCGEKANISLTAKAFATGNTGVAVAMTGWATTAALAIGVLIFASLV